MPFAMTIEERFAKYAMPIPFAGCWVWLGYVDKAGYARINIRHKGKRKAALAHKVAYEYFVCEVPAGLELDHKCRVRCCVNPEHLEPVTRLENVRRGLVPFVSKNRFAGVTQCQRGHPFSGENLGRSKNGRRYCKFCRQVAQKRSEEKKREQRRSSKRA
jgi:hypothetical protein